MLKSLRIQWLVLQGIMFALFLSLYALENLNQRKTGKILATLHSQESLFEASNNISTNLDEWSQHFYKVLYWSKEKEKREKVESFQPQSSVLMDKFLSSCNSYSNLIGNDNRETKFVDLKAPCEKIKEASLDYLQLAWSGEQSILQEKLESFETLKSNLLSILGQQNEIIKNKMISTQNQIKERENHYNSFTKLITFSVLIFFSIANFWFYRRWRKYHNLSFTRFENQGYKLQRSFEDLESHSVSLYKQNQDNHLLLDKISKESQTALQLLPKAKDLATRTTELTKDLETLWPIYHQKKIIHKEELEKLLIEMDLQNFKPKIELLLKHFEEFSTSFENSIQNMRENHKNSHMIKGSLELVFRNWTSIEKTLNNLMRFRQLQDPNWFQFREAIKQFSYDLNSFEGMRKDWEEWSKQNQSAELSPFVVEKAIIEPGEEYKEGLIVGIKDYELDGESTFASESSDLKKAN
jgi:hypothetical protein